MPYAVPCLLAAHVWMSTNQADLRAGLQAPNWSGCLITVLECQLASCQNPMSTHHARDLDHHVHRSCVNEANRELSFSAGGRELCKEPKHPRRIAWLRHGPGRFTAEFKMQAVKRVLEGGKELTEVVTELGVGMGQLST